MFLLNLNITSLNGSHGSYSSIVASTGGAGVPRWLSSGPRKATITADECSGLMGSKDTGAKASEGAGGSSVPGLTAGARSVLLSAGIAAEVGSAAGVEAATTVSPDEAEEASS